MPADLVAPAALLGATPVQVVDEAGARSISFGRRVPQEQSMDGVGALLADDGRLLAAAQGRDGWWHPVVVLEPA